MNKHVVQLLDDLPHGSVVQYQYVRLFLFDKTQTMYKIMNMVTRTQRPQPTCSVRLIAAVGEGWKWTQSVYRQIVVLCTDTAIGSISAAYTRKLLTARSCFIFESRSLQYFRFLAVPRYRLNTYGRRAFSVAGPTVWNSLPDFIRDPTISADCFRRLLKTYLFARY